MIKSILLVEDIPVIKSLYLSSLVDAGFKVDSASTGAEALEKVRINDEYDLILLDLLLPQMNGIEFLERLRKNKKDTKVLILSDFSNPETFVRAEELGIVDYLMKSEFTPTELVKKIQEYNNS